MVGAELLLWEGALGQPRLPIGVAARHRTYHLG